MSKFSSLNPPRALEKAIREPLTDSFGNLSVEAGKTNGILPHRPPRAPVEI